MKDFDDDRARHTLKLNRDVILIEIDIGVPGEEVRAALYPRGLRSTAARAGGTVAWEGIDAIASVVMADVDPEPWVRRLQLLWAAVSPANLPVDSKFDPMAWMRVKVSMPEAHPFGCRRAIVELERESWTATSGWSTGDEQDTSRAIPPELRALDAGSVLVEMSARLILNIRWL